VLSDRPVIGQGLKVGACVILRSTDALRDRLTFGVGGILDRLFAVSVARR